jgi:hypothetical protein
MADMKRVLGRYINDFEMHKGHFYAYGFFRTISGYTYYFALSDVRFFSAKHLLIRTAKNFDDFTGGQNQYIALDENFENNLRNKVV